MSPAIELVVGIVRAWEFPDRPTVKPVIPESRDNPDVVTARSNEVKDEPLLAG
jgi:hypothetical protein